MHTMPTVARAGRWTLDECLAQSCRRFARRIALSDGATERTYAQLDERASRLADSWAGSGIGRGDRVAILAENRLEYIEATCAAARLGVTLCALNWRLARAELDHCVRLVEPSLVLVSPRFVQAWGALELSAIPVVQLGEDYESRLASASAQDREPLAEPEDGLLVLYTSGTTGLPKGAVISHRAELARLDVSRLDANLAEGDHFVAWAPMFHMVSLEHALHVLAMGGTVHVVDGADVERIAELVETHAQWWLVLIPGMIEPLVQTLKQRHSVPKGIKRIGALADLVPGQLIAEASRLLRAPYWNSFGSTETGMLPAAGTCFAPGIEPTDLGKAHNSNYLARLVDADDLEVTPGEAGEMAVRGPTVFSGYWNQPEANAQAFRGGWFHMGDLFVERPDGLLSFADRSKYLIKSGGENIYPIEIERALMADPRVAEAVVVRKPDATWGEVPVAFVALVSGSARAEDLIAACRERLSSYKLPREVRFVASADVFPRSTSGKVQRQQVEAWLKEIPRE